MRSHVADVGGGGALDERHESHVVDLPVVIDLLHDVAPVERAARDGRIDRQPSGGDVVHGPVLQVELVVAEGRVRDLEDVPPGVAIDQEVLVLVAGQWPRRAREAELLDGNDERLFHREGGVRQLVAEERVGGSHER